jgi:hypothetical protein
MVSHVAGTAILLDGSNGNDAVLEFIHQALLTAFERCEVVNLAESHILPCMRRLARSRAATGTLRRCWYGVF